MKVIMDAEPRINGSLCSAVPMEMEEVGSRAWIRLTLDGREYSLSYHEFWAAARAVCLDIHDPQ